MFKGAVPKHHVRAMQQIIEHGVLEHLQDKVRPRDPTWGMGHTGHLLLVPFPFISSCKPKGSPLVCRTVGLSVRLPVCLAQEVLTRSSGTSSGARGMSSNATSARSRCTGTATARWSTHGTITSCRTTS